MKFTGILIWGSSVFQILGESFVLHLHQVQILDGGESVVSSGALVGVRVASNLSGVVSSGFISLSELEPFEVLTKNFIVFFTCTIRPNSYSYDSPERLRSSVSVGHTATPFPTFSVAGVRKLPYPSNGIVLRLRTRWN
ncbi:hypothetical protein ACFX2I_028035 [Malus domestica]